MNRRTAEQGTAEYRSEKHSLIFLKFLLFEIPCSIFDIQNIKESEIRSPQSEIVQLHALLATPNGYVSLEWAIVHRLAVTTVPGMSGAAL